MRIHVGADHAALEAKTALIDHLRQAGHDVTDHGPFVYDAEDDYPVFCLRAAEAVAADADALGFVLGGSGNGEQMAANKVAGVRAALCYGPELAQLAREHNDARICSIGGRFTTPEESLAIADAFVATPFSGVERHARRITMLERYEATGELPDLPDSAR